MNQTVDQTLRKAIKFHRTGKVQKADRLYTAILKIQPKHPDANHNMGVLTVGIGKIKKALPFFQVALEVNPNIPQFWVSYIDALSRLNKIDYAKGIFKQAKERGFQGYAFDMLEQQLNRVVETTNIVSKYQNPPEDKIQSIMDQYDKRKFQKALDQASQLLHQFPRSIILYNIIGANNQRLGQFDPAVEAYKKALVINPDYADAYNNMGVAFKEQGKLEEAIKAYNKAISIKHDYAEAHNNIGNAFKEQGKLGEAIKAYNKAISIKHDYAEAHNNMGNAFKEQGKLEEAINAYNKAITIKPDYAEAYHNISNTLEGLTFERPSHNLQKLITLLLDKKSYVRPRSIAQGAIRLLKFEPNVKKYLGELSSDELASPPEEVVRELSKLPLLLKLMSICPLPDPELENLFRKLRASLLSTISSLKCSLESLTFQSALALQCFTNEYIYNQSEHEKKDLKILEEAVIQALINGEQPNPQYLLCLASYRALNKYEWCDLVVTNSDIEDVFTRQVIEPRTEKNLRSDISVLKEITDTISSEVRQQYESSPYPRWVDTALSIEPAPISRVIDELQLKLFYPAINNVEFPKILVAGCGTGQHSIGTASRFKGSKVLAIDLSLSSLVYAKRKTDELGIQNIDYMQADILDLVKLDKQFEIIESSGVLHHMNDPMAGWSVLTDCLKPGGLMNIGLYSELGRKNIVEIREEITQSGIGSSNAEMQSFRNMVMQSNKNHYKTILGFSDFYSLSELKDLLFHVQEHRFSIPKIKKCLAELGLNFCGFGTNKIVQNFKLAYPEKESPYNLNKWQAYEEANPKAFLGMYQFWCQKEQ